MTIGKKMGLGFGVLLALVVTLASVVLFNLSDMNRQFSFVIEHDAPVIANARHLSKLVVDMETGQRWFVITGKDEFLEPYEQALGAFETLLDKEKALVSDNPPQVALLEEIKASVQEWLEKTAGAEIAMRRKIGEATIDARYLQEVLSKGVGKRLMDEFMALGHQIEVAFSELGDWEGAFAVEIIEKCMADREDGQRGFLITGQEEFLDKYHAGEQKKLPQNFARLRAIVSERGRGDELSERVDQLEQLTREWIKEAAEPEIAARRAMNEHPETIQDVTAMLELGTGKRILDRVREHFRKFIQEEERLTAARFTSASEASRTTTNTTILLGLISVIFGGIIAMKITQDITRPVRKLAGGVEMVAKGDLSQQIETQAKDEIGELSRSFNRMVDDLKRLEGARTDEIAERKKVEKELRNNNVMLIEALEGEKHATFKLEAAMSRLEVTSTTDTLTGLPNRAVFMDRLEQARKRSKRDGSRFAVLFFDFDRFKIVNDSLGHDVGDALLYSIADIFRSEARESDTVARFGGDEFVVLLDGLSEWSDAEKKATQLLDKFAEPHDISGHRVVSTASIGLVTNEHPHQHAADVIRDADAAMYQAKAQGKARIVSFDSAMHERAMTRLSIEADLRLTIEDKQLRLMYQPIIDLATGAVSGFEALVRWDHPERGLVSPIEFIPIAEETGLIIEIGQWVLRTACRQIADWNRRLGLEPDLSINVNISKRQLLGPSFVEDVLECLRKFDMPAETLKLEITESVISDERCDVAPLLTELREQGLHIALDDFGTGFLSLSTLHNYPIDVLKIDQSFVRSLDGDRSLLAVVSSVTALAENLGIATVAEGIETADTIGVLQSIGCTWGQGYYFAKPMTPADAEAYLLGIHKQKYGA